MKASKILSLLLALCLVLSLSAGVFAEDYSDTKGHWAESAIDRWSGYGVVKGDGTGFNPNGTMTRAEGAEVFKNLLGLSDKTDAATFSDVPAGAWYAEAVALASAAGIINGVGEGKMDPNGSFSREQFFVVFGRSVGVVPETSAETSFTDSGNVSNWAKGYINALANRGYIGGMGDGSLAPDLSINRASVMSLLDKSISGYANEDGQTVESTGDGIVLVVANNVTVKGSVEQLVVAAGAAEDGKATVNLDGAQVAEMTLTVPADVKMDAESEIKKLVETTEEAASSTLTDAEGKEYEPAETVTAEAYAEAVEDAGAAAAAAEEPNENQGQENQEQQNQEQQSSSGSSYETIPSTTYEAYAAAQKINAALKVETDNMDGVTPTAAASYSNASKNLTYSAGIGLGKDASFDNIYNELKAKVKNEVIAAIAAVNGATVKIGDKSFVVDTPSAVYNQLLTAVNANSAGNALTTLGDAKTVTITFKDGSIITYNFTFVEKA